MKRKIIILVALAVLLTSTAAYAASAGNTTNGQLALEKVEHTDATVTANKLNLREGPSTSFPSICKLEKGQAVTIIGKLGDWYAVYNAANGVVGAVDGRYVQLSDGTVATSANADNASVAAKTPPAKGSTPSAVDVGVSEDEQKLLELVNKARESEGLEPLVMDENLMKVARTKAKDMIENSYFSHQSPTYGSPFDMMRQFDNAFKSAGENIAGNKTVEGAFKAWMASDSHKKNILNSGFKITGIGIETSSTYGKILVQQFIGR